MRLASDRRRLSEEISDVMAASCWATLMATRSCEDMETEMPASVSVLASAFEGAGGLFAPFPESCKVRVWVGEVWLPFSDMTNLLRCGGEVPHETRHRKRDREGSGTSRRLRLKFIDEVEECRGE